MTKDEATKMVAKLRRWSKWNNLPSSDVALLRSQVEANENISFLFAMSLFGLIGRIHDLWRWSNVMLLGAFAFMVYCRWEVFRFRKAIRLFEEQGPQMVEELNNNIPNQPPQGSSQRLAP